MREFVKTLLIAFMSNFRSLKPGVFILNGHYLTRNSSYGVDSFRKLLTKMSEAGVELINIQDAVKAIESGATETCASTYVAFTFDDGFEDCYLSLAPALEEFGVNACFFINPNFIDGDEAYIQRFTSLTVRTPHKRPMTWEQIDALHQRGFVIGNHTLDHLRLAELNYQTSSKQICASKKIIEDRLGVPCEYFAWPYGQVSDVNERVLECAADVHKFIFSGCNFKTYYSFGGMVLNRRHFEPCWAWWKLKFFLSFVRK